MVSPPASLFIFHQRQIFHRFIQKAYNLFNTNIHRTSFLFHILDRNTRIDILVHHNKRSVMTQKLKIIIGFQSLDFSYPQLLFSIRHIINSPHFFKKSITITDTVIHCIPTPHITVWIERTLQTIRNIQTTPVKTALPQISSRNHFIRPHISRIRNYGSGKRTDPEMTILEPILRLVPFLKVTLDTFNISLRYNIQKCTPRK